MGHRLSKIYTRTGDDGTTGLGDGSRVPKDHIRVEAYGTTDELNSSIGLILAEPDLPESVRTWLLEIQHDLFDLGGELCIPGYQLLSAQRIEVMETWIDSLNADLPMLKEFILPGGNRAAAACHLARTICRRAERRLLALSRQEEIQPTGIHYLNRLSDFLFVAARVLARQGGGQEVLWQRQRT
jgi:cob(I)alamin adenosyltransferase